MKSLKIYLAIVSLLLLLAIACGVYVWYTVQKTHTQMEEVSKEVKILPTATETPEIKEGTSPEPERAPVAPAPEEEVKPIVVDTNTLSDSQRKVLESFGFSGTLTITPAMISCAEDAVGKDRLQEIMDGSAPSPLESLKLLPCFKA
jgi:hypothetical protein